MDLGSSISKIRKMRNLRQAELADRCEISQAYLSQIEKNRKEPNLSTLKVISSELGVPLPIIFFDSLDVNDIPSEKRSGFLMIAPAVKNMISEIFFDYT